MIPDARMIDFYDRHVSRMISEKYGLIVFDMWESEKITGDPRRSQYIRGADE